LYFVDLRITHHSLGATVDKTVADLNIAHFKKLLSTAVNPAKRETIARLLAEEEAKLARALDPKKDSSDKA
jgi:hypothetical protein